MIENQSLIDTGASYSFIAGSVFELLELAIEREDLLFLQLFNNTDLTINVTICV